MQTLNLEYIFAQVYYLFTRSYSGPGEIISFDTLYFYFLIFKLILALVSLALSLWLFYFIYKTIEIRRAEREQLLAMLANIPSDGAPKTNPTWEKVERSLNSDNPADWKIAIIEADTMLDTMLSTMGYKGDSLGDRLKSIEPSDFLTLQDAWDAHKVRNQIAHQGGYELTKRETQRVIGLYENVFREFENI